MTNDRTEEVSAGSTSLNRVLMLSGHVLGSTQTTAREIALSTLLAAQMTAHPVVRSFRRAQGLTDHRVPWEQFEHWMDIVDPIRIHVFSAYEYHFFLPGDVIMQNNLTDGPEDEEITTIKITRADLSHNELKPLVLPYALPDDPRERERPVWRHDSPLANLYLVASQLEELTAWTKAQAVLFVATGEIPLASQLAVDFRINEEYPALSRVLMSVDPRLSPREVADRFRQVRQEVVGPRHRDMTDKHLQLAVFSILSALEDEQAQRDGKDGRDVGPRRESLQKRLSRWNAQYPQWAYRDARNFSREIGLAHRRVLGQVERGRPRGGKSTRNKQQ